MKKNSQSSIKERQSVKTQHTVLLFTKNFEQKQLSLNTSQISTNNSNPGKLKIHHRRTHESNCSMVNPYDIDFYRLLCTATIEFLVQIAPVLRNSPQINITNQLRLGKEVQFHNAVISSTTDLCGNINSMNGTKGMIFWGVVNCANESTFFEVQ